jgi:hypothetical protein
MQAIALTISNDAEQGALLSVDGLVVAGPQGRREGHGRGRPSPPEGDEGSRERGRINGTLHQATTLIIALMQNQLARK